VSLRHPAQQASHYRFPAAENKAYASRTTSAPIMLKADPTGDKLSGMNSL